MKEEFDFESIKNKAIEQLKAGKSLLWAHPRFCRGTTVFQNLFR